jgi:hypothetical protein
MRSVPSLTCLALLAACLLGVSCGDPPNKEIAQAQGAIDAARAAGAAEFAPRELDAAVAALAKSSEAVEQRDYRQALGHALDARELAETAARAGADEKARVAAETERVLHGVELAIGRIRAALEAAAAHVPPRDLAAETKAVESAEETVHEARAAIGRDDFAAARSALDGVEDRLTNLASEIDAAAAARATRRPARRSGR